MAKKRRSFYEAIIDNLLGRSIASEQSEELANAAIVERFDENGEKISEGVTKLKPSNEEEFFNATPTTAKVTKTKNGKVVQKEKINLVPSSEEEVLNVAPVSKTKVTKKDASGNVISEEETILAPSNEQEFFSGDTNNTADWLKKMHK